MELSPYIESVRVGVVNASSLADEQTQQVAERLGAAIESSTRLALIQALSDAASSISAELAPSSVELRMVGNDPDFVVSIQTVEAEPTLLMPEQEGAATGEFPTLETEDEPVARITLRLPQSVKARVDEMASAEGISTNAWLIRAVMDALSDRSGSRPDWPLPPHPPMAPHPPMPPHSPIPPSPELIFGEAGPFGPEGVFGQKGAFGRKGVFGQKGPFGPGGMFGDRPKESWREERRSRGNVQGWVR
jgi:Ribbon-helix-helix protein, copG family